LNEVEIHTKKQISVLGVLFDSKLEWSLQVENSVRMARSSLQGLRVINKYFTTTKVNITDILLLLSPLLRIADVTDTLPQRSFKE
jgi:hypothetical protein